MKRCNNAPSENTRDFKGDVKGLNIVSMFLIYETLKTRKGAGLKGLKICKMQKKCKSVKRCVIIALFVSKQMCFFT